MRVLSYFNLVFGSVIALLGIFGAAFATEFRAGIGGAVFRPPLVLRIGVAIIFACVGFSFVYSGLGSPPQLAFADNIGRSFLDVFCIFVAVFAIFRAGASVPTKNDRKLHAHDLGLIGRVLIFVALTLIAIWDLAARIRR